MRSVLDTWHLTRRSVGVLIGSWLLVLGATRLAMPQIDPSVYATDRPMESLAVAALVLPVVATIGVLPERTPWLSQVAGRDLRAWRAALLCAALSPQWLAVLAVAQVGHLPLVQVTGVWLLLVGSGLLALVAWGQVAGGLIPALIVLTFSQASGIPPFSTNLVYNLHLQQTLILLDAVLTPTAMLAFILRGAR